MSVSDERDGRIILRVDSGADHPGSVSRRLADELQRRIVGPDDVLVRRAATEGLPVVTGAWVAASFADGDPAALAMSDELVDELLSADELVLVAPVYNFGIPAAMKAWIDQVVRAGRTFRFTDRGPVGLLPAERAWIVTASAGTPIGSEIDFNTTYLRAILGFIGVSDIRVIAAEQLQANGESAVARALEALDAATSAPTSDR
ncbi:MAG: FMN-dependent NADH-azoreductase [Acidimicrobiia bacterium]